MIIEKVICPICHKPMKKSKKNKYLKLQLETKKYLDQGKRHQHHSSSVGIAIMYRPF